MLLHARYRSILGLPLTALRSNEREIALGIHSLDTKRVCASQTRGKLRDIDFYPSVGIASPATVLEAKRTASSPRSEKASHDPLKEA